MVKAIQIRNLPDVVHRRLGARAAPAGMSLSEFLLAELSELAALPMRQHGHGPLLDCGFELRHNLSAYDAPNLALAEGLAATLGSCDAALADVPGARAPVELIA